MNNAPPPITYDRLKRLRACREQLKDFEAEYGRNWVPPMTVEEAVRVSHLFDFEWLAQKVLRGSAWAAYDAARVSAWAAYRSARDSAWAAYRSARAAYIAAMAPARAAFVTARAQAFAEAYLSQAGQSEGAR